MRIIFLNILGVLCLCAHSVGQYANDWVDYSSAYLAFPVVQDGWYKLTYEQLEQSGMIVGNINPKQVHLFAAGEEIRQMFFGDEDELFEPGEYYRCWLHGHGGEMEVGAYGNEQWRPDVSYSLFNDTLYHYISIQENFATWLNEIAMPEAVDVPEHQDVMYSVRHALHQNYYIGRADNNGIALPNYDEAEGWFDPAFGFANYIVQMPTPYRNTSEPDVEVQWKIAGVNSALGIPNHHLQATVNGNSNVYFDTTFTGHRLIQKTFMLDASSNWNQLTMGFRAVNDLGVAADLMALGSMTGAYHRLPEFHDGANHTMRVKAVAGADWTKLALQLSGYQQPAVYRMDGGTPTRLPVVWNGTTLDVWIPWEENSEQTLMLSESSLSIVPDVFQPVAMEDFTTTMAAGDLVIITHRKLIDAALNYAIFKEANGHSVQVVDVEQLYHQYGGGVMKNPLSIRRFLSRLVDMGKAPGHLFLVGKSIHEAPVSGESGARNSPVLFAENLVPTWGNPGSDALFSAGLNGTLYEPAVPTGRLSANGPQDVLNYLNKAVEQQNQPAGMWRKNVMHFGGGSIAYEQNMFRTYLNAYKILAEGQYVGARVHSFFKNTAEPVQLNVSDSIQLLINEGASVMTFFGHASSTGFDQNIDAPESYSNQGRYPLLIGNSCYTGNIHLASGQSASERFVLAANRGVIGFLAKGDLGIPTYLDMYTSNLYRHLFDQSYGASIGQCMQRAIADFQSPNDFYKQNAAWTFVFHGDPSVVLFPFDRPDFVVEEEQIQLPGLQLAASPESRTVKAWIANAGKTTTAQCEVVLEHLFPDGTDTVYVQTLNGLWYGDTVIWTIPGLEMPGSHHFGVRVDLPAQTIDELDDFSNNTVSSMQVVVTDGDIRPVYPYPFAVIDEQQPVLRASTTYALEPARTYWLQADTTPFFNSPLLASMQQTSFGGTIQWPMPFALEDSMVVFWRCSPVEEPLRWRTSSFQHIAGRRGWGMQHRAQMSALSAQGMDYQEENWNWQFETATAQLKCEVYGAADSYFENLATRYQLNLDVQEYGGYGYGLPAIMVAVLDSATLYPWLSNYAGLSPENDFDNTLVSANARGRQEKYFIFQQNDPAQLSGLAEMLQTGIEEGHHVLLYSWQYALPTLWPQSLSDALSAQGLDDLVAVQDSLPFIYYFQKGSPSSVSGTIGATSDAFLQLSVDLQGAQGNGILQTPKIGPVYQWQSAEWTFGAVDVGSTDGMLSQLRGLDPSPATTLFGGENQWVMPTQDLAGIDADAFEQLQINFLMGDSASGTAPDLRRLHVWYEEVPEFALDAQSGFMHSADTLEEGQTLQVVVPIRNIGHVTGDSLLVRYQVVDAKGNVHKIPYALQSPLAADDVLADTIRLATAGFAGWNRFVMAVNPKDSITGRPPQREQFDFNNALEWMFYVDADRVPPVLEVTADGRHIIHGELVSATPELLISLRDENMHLVMNNISDTTAFRVYLTHPDGQQKVLRFEDPEVEIVPAAHARVPYRIYYRPQRLADGMYELRVEAADKSGNSSGALDYRIQFRVVNEASISEMMNYPNPFSTSTRFVFTITGSELPEELKIQIMTIGGKVVREILAHELGAMHIGRNISEYAWDGRDEFGDQLANGVYFYRTVVRYRGEDMKHLETAADAYFKQGFGKMYLMR